MPGHLPSLDRAALARLRRLVSTMHRENTAVPLAQLVELATRVRSGAGVTVDFEASHELGEPMVVLRVPAPARPATCLRALSRRELEIAALVALSNKEIARRLFLSLATVKDHVHHILVKTGLPNRAAVAVAYKGHEP